MSFNEMIDFPYLRGSSPWYLLQTIFLSFHSQRVQKPLQRTLPVVFFTKLRLIHYVRLVWRHKITNVLSKNYFCKDQRPPRPILARMAPADKKKQLADMYTCTSSSFYTTAWMNHLYTLYSHLISCEHIITLWLYLMTPESIQRKKLSGRTKFN